MSDPYAYPPADFEATRRRPGVKAQTAGATLVGGSVAGGRLTGAAAMVALATGAMALGALAIGALFIGRLVVGDARFRRLEIDELVVKRLTLREP